MVIYLWKISHGLVSGYKVPFTDTTSRTGRRVLVHEMVMSGVLTPVLNAKENS